MGTSEFPSHLANGAQSIDSRQNAECGTERADYVVSSMLFNSIQNFDEWQDYFDHPKGNTLGVLGALYQIGSLCSIPIV